MEVDRMLEIIIDGAPYKVPAGTTVLRAAQAAGIHIPTLCDHKELVPYGGCRLCLVDVKGFRTLQPSCTLPVEQGMEVQTDTENVRSARKFVLSMLFSERNHFCPFCPVSGGDCELQNAAYHEGMTHWPIQPGWKPEKVDASHPFLVIDHNRCILCRRCVRACAELVGNHTLGIAERGAKSYLVADLDAPMGESSCVNCGTCLQVCPTGAIIDRAGAYMGLETDLEPHATVCIGCSIGCGINVWTRNNHIVRIDGRWEAPVNAGVICQIGRFQPLQEQRQRIKTPLIRRNGELVEASWDQALDLLASHLKPLAGMNENGLAALASTRLPAESLYLFKELFSGCLGSNMVTSIEEGQTTAVPARLADEIGKPFEGKLEALQDADCFITVGVNLGDNHPVAGFFVKRARGTNANLITIDPSENPLDNFANCVLKPTPGTDVEVMQGLMAAAAQLGLAKSPVSFDIQATLINAAEKSGISAEDFLRTAHAIARSSKPAFIYGKGITAKSGQPALEALLDLARMTGALTQDFSRVIGTKGEANSLAAAQYRLEAPFYLNGQQVVYLALGDDRPSARLMQRLEQVPFLVVQASYASELTEQADVVLPVEIWAEQEGHYLNLEGRLQKAVRTLNPPAQVWSNQAVLAELARRLGMNTHGDWKVALKDRTAPVEIDIQPVESILA
jgi:formate dehydrogenase major subunit